MSPVNEALRRATEDLRIVTESMAAPVTRCSRDLRYLWVSRPYADWLHRSVEEIVGQSIRDVIGDEAFERLLPRFQEVLSGKVVRYEEQIEFQGIGARWITATYAPTLSADGKPDGWVAVVNDITERRRLEDSVRRSEEQLRRSLRAGRMGCFGVDLTTNVVTADAAHRRMWGFDPDAVLTRDDIFQRIHPEDVARIEKDERAMRLGEMHEIEFRISRPDGEVRWLAGYTEVVRDSEGEPLELIGMNADITERKEAEEELRRRESEFRALADNTPALVARFDRQLRHLFVNRQVERVTGLSAADYLGKTNREMGFTDDLHTAGDERLRSVFETGETATLEFTFPSSQGPRHFHCWFGPEFGPDGEVASALCITQDVTAQKALEIELQRRMAELAEADRRKDEFIAMLGHELRNPLGPIRNAVEILNLLGSPEPPAMRAREMIDRQVTHMTRLVDDLLDVSRISQGKIRLKSERCDLTAIVRQTVEDCRAAADESGLGLELETPDERLVVDGDPTRLAQVMSNLVHNAAKFTDRGGRVMVRAWAEVDTGTAVVSVQDTGMGMTPEVLASLFQPFTQADQAADRSRGGLGLGLALVKGLLDLHGGSVTAHSDGPGRGSTITFRLPLAKAASAAVPQPAAATFRSRLRVLVIEDHPDAAESMRILLSLAGHDVETAPDGAGGLERARAFRPHVILCDIGLPSGMDGYAVARALRADPQLKRVRLIALTGYGREHDLALAREAGFDHHLIKPADFEALAKALDSAPRREPCAETVGSLG